MRNPWVVAILNFFFWGLGTLLLGKRRAGGPVSAPELAALR